MKRRHFLSTSLAGAAGLHLVSCSGGDSGPAKTSAFTGKNQVPPYKLSRFTPGERKKSASDKIVLALIGAGSWGSNLAMETARLGANAEFKYICDVDDTRGGRAISEIAKLPCGHSTIYPCRGVGMRVHLQKLQATSYKLQATSCKLQATSYKLQAASYKLQAESYKLNAGS